MYKKKSITLALLINLMLLSPAKANKVTEECFKRTTEESRSRCLDQQIKSLDRELKTWVNHHEFNLEEKALSNGRDAALNMFKRSQNSFISFRENNCRWRYLTISPSKGASLAYKQCYIYLSQSRITELSKDNNSFAAPLN